MEAPANDVIGEVSKLPQDRVSRDTPTLAASNPPRIEGVADDALPVKTWQAEHPIDKSMTTMEAIPLHQLDEQLQHLLLEVGSTQGVTTAPIPLTLEDTSGNGGDSLNLVYHPAEQTVLVEMNRAHELRGKATEAVVGGDESSDVGEANVRSIGSDVDVVGVIDSNVPVMNGGNDRLCTTDRKDVPNVPVITGTGTSFGEKLVAKAVKKCRLNEPVKILPKNPLRHGGLMLWLFVCEPGIYR